MKKKEYHHGDLRKELIEKGIELINDKGKEAISLRKVAEKCGVSNAAPYSHFRNKEQLIEAMQVYVFNLLGNELEKIRRNYENSPEILLKLGKGYILFFCNYPQYHSFIFSRKNVKIDLSLDNIQNLDNKAINILKETAVEFFEKLNFSKEIIQNKIIAMWALVEGLATLVTMSDMDYDEEWELKIEEILSSVIIV